METIRRQVDPLQPDASLIRAAADAILAGKLVAFPTETVYGLGAHALQPAAVAQIYLAKGRPSHNPLIVHVADAAAAQALVTAWPETAAKLAAHFWPGPLTLVLPRAECIPDLVTGGGNTVGLRVPAHPVALALLQAAGVPIAAPSANRSNAISPTQAEHVWQSLAGRIDWILDGGPCRAGIESTVLDLTSSPPRILRPGPLTAAELAAVLNGPVTEFQPQAIAETDNSPTPLAAPGQLARHYAPRAKLMLATGTGAATVLEQLRGGARVGWLAGPDTAVLNLPRLQVLTMPAEPTAYAAELYAALHTLDAVGVEVLVCPEPPGGDAWLAIRDRLTRAAVAESQP